MTDAKLWLFLFMVGCSAPPEVLELEEKGQDIEDVALRNERHIQDRVLQAWRMADDFRLDLVYSGALLSATDDQGRVPYSTAKQLMADHKRDLLDLEEQVRVVEAARRQVDDQWAMAREFRRVVRRYLTLPGIKPEDVEAVGKIIEEEVQ